MLLSGIQLHMSQVYCSGWHFYLDFFKLNPCEYIFTLFVLPPVCMSGRTCWISDNFWREKWQISHHWQVEMQQERNAGWCAKPQAFPFLPYCIYLYLVIYVFMLGEIFKFRFCKLPFYITGQGNIRWKPKISEQKHMAYCQLVLSVLLLWGSCTSYESDVCSNDFCFPRPHICITACIYWWVTYIYWYI